MQFQGEVNIEAATEAVWKFLTDPHAVGQCVPGLESIEVITPDEKFRAVAQVGLGSVKVRFTTDVEWLELEAPNRATMKAHGRAPGSTMDASSTMVLEPRGEASTQLIWTADVTVQGTIASLASRLMSGVSRRLTAEFFDCVKEKIEA